MDQTAFTLQVHHICLYLVNVHQTVPPLTSGSSHLITAYYSFIDPVFSGFKSALIARSQIWLGPFLVTSSLSETFGLLLLLLLAYAIKTHSWSARQ